MTTATYLYCVVRAAEKPSTAGVPQGLSEATPAEVVPVRRSLWLVAAEVPLSVYGSGNLEPLLRDLNRVAEIAVAHESVVEHFARRHELTVVPMKLFTMFSARARAVADVARRSRSILAAMDRIDGSEEWGVRITRSSVPAAQPGSARAPASGAAFLSAKKKAKDDVRNAKLAAAEAALSAFERLAAIAKESRRRDDLPGGGATKPLLDAAFLVTLGARDKFTDAARRESEACSRAGAQMTVTGPWPAYNFIDAEEGR